MVRLVQERKTGFDEVDEIPLELAPVELTMPTHATIGRAMRPGCTLPTMIMSFSTVLARVVASSVAASPLL